jgi:Zn-dependent protease
MRLGEGCDDSGGRTITRVAEHEVNSRPAGVPLGRILGFPVRLSLSWLVLAVLVTVVYGNQVGSYGFGALFVVGLLGSVLLHELGHAVASRRFGTGVKGITLELLGGYTEMERDAPRPLIEAAVSLAGPATSMIIALGAGAGAATLPDDGATARFLGHLAVSNAIIAIFNALPGLPLDGGRALHALIWAATGDRYRGQLVAGAAGVGLAVGVAGVAGWLWLAGWLSLVGAVFTVVVAGSIGLGGLAAVRYGRAGGRLRRVTVDRLTRPIFGVPTGTSVAEAHRLAGGAPGTVFGVLDPDGRLWAVVPEAEDATVPVDRREVVEIDELARLVGAYRSVPAGLTGDDVLRAVEADPVGDYLVTAGEDVVGILRVSDIDTERAPLTRRSGT